MNNDDDNFSVPDEFVLYSCSVLLVLPNVIPVLMLNRVTVLLIWLLIPEDQQRQLSSMFDNNWDVIGGQLNRGMLTLMAGVQRGTIITLQTCRSWKLFTGYRYKDNYLLPSTQSHILSSPLLISFAAFIWLHHVPLRYLDFWVRTRVVNICKTPSRDSAHHFHRKARLL